MSEELPPQTTPKYRMTWKPHEADSCGKVDLYKHGSLILSCALFLEDAQELAADLGCECATVRKAADVAADTQAPAPIAGESVCPK